MIDKRGKAKKGYTKIDEHVWQVFLSFLLDQAKHPLRKCYQYTQLYIQNTAPELYEDIPAYCTFTRHVKADIPDAILTLGRDGDKAFDDRCAPYIRRTYDNMDSNDYWIGDNHTIDVIVGDGEKTFRLYLTAFMDARSGIMTCIYITDTPSSQASIYSLRRGIKKYGIPKNVYLDNGREFLTFDFGGSGHRKKKKDEDKFTPPPILERLGINMVNALVRNAKAKIIERRFLDFKNSISRLFATYTGGNVVEKPEILKVELKNGNIPEKEAFIQEIEDLIETEGKKYDVCVAIGPMIMMKFVCLTTKKYDLRTIVSMNPIMVDGTGMCGACRLTVGGEVKFACVDGPEFDGHLVDFDQAMKRQQIYKTKEGRAFLKAKEGDTHHGGCGNCGGND